MMFDNASVSVGQAVFPGCTALVVSSLVNVILSQNKYYDLWIDLFWKCSVPVGMLLHHDYVCYLIGLTYNACRHELVDIVLLENVNMLQNVEDCLHL